MGIFINMGWLHDICQTKACRILQGSLKPHYLLFVFQFNFNATYQFCNQIIDGSTDYSS